MKTAMTVLQEMGMKHGVLPEYTFISQTGLQHQATFEYSCSACGEAARGYAHSKKEARQEAARCVLMRLASAGRPVPPPWGLRAALSAAAAPGAAPATADSRHHVALLKEFCEEYRLFAPVFSLVGDSGLPHERKFTVRVAVGQHARAATALNKKAARQHAAEAMYRHLRESLSSTKDFVEADALARALDKEMGRFTTPEEKPWRLPLDQPLAHYHCGLERELPHAARAHALEALRQARAAGMSAEVQLGVAAVALQLQPQWGQLPTKDEPLVTIELPRTAPSLVHVGASREEAAEQMVQYLQMCLIDPPKDSLSTTRKTKGGTKSSSE